MVHSVNRFRTRNSGRPGCRDGYIHHKTLVDSYLEDLAFSENPRYAAVVGAMRYALLSREERVRAALCMEAAGCFGLDPEEVLPSAAAIELIQSVCVIHGGLPAMNSSRREMSRCHEKFGRANAILAGDAFFSEAVALISTRQSGTPEQILAVVGELASAAGVAGMVGGQALGVMDGWEPGLEELETMHRCGMGALVEASARIGAVLAGAASEETESISKYARWFGRCLRVTSDLLKATLADGDPGSFVRAYGLSGARQLADEALREAIGALGGLDGDTQGLAEIARLVRSPEAAGLFS